MITAHILRLPMKQPKVQNISNRKINTKNTPIDAKLSKFIQAFSFSFVGTCARSTVYVMNRNCLIGQGSIYILMAQKRYAKMQLTVKRQTKGRKLNHILCTGRATVVSRMSLFHFLKARKPVT